MQAIERKNEGIHDAVQLARVTLRGTVNGQDFEVQRQRKKKTFTKYDACACSR